MVIHEITRTNTNQDHFVNFSVISWIVFTLAISTSQFLLINILLLNLFLDIDPCRR